MDQDVNRLYTVTHIFGLKEFMPLRPAFLLCIICIVHNSFSQSNKTSVVPWFFPGVIYKANPKLDLWGQYGVNYRQSIHLFYLQGFIKTGKHFIINPAYLYLNIDRPNDTRLQDHTFMSSVIYTFNIKKFVIDDRNMLWNRFRLQAKDLHFYRNRLRVSWPLNTSPIKLRPYLFDEVSYFFNEGSWTRNRFAIGLNCNIAKRFILDIAWLRESDKFNGNTNLLFVQGMLQLSHRKVERDVHHN